MTYEETEHIADVLDELINKEALVAVLLGLRSNFNAEEIEFEDSIIEYFDSLAQEIASDIADGEDEAEEEY